FSIFYFLFSFVQGFKCCAFKGFNTSACFGESSATIAQCDTLRLASAKAQQPSLSVTGSSDYFLFFYFLFSFVQGFKSSNAARSKGSKVHWSGGLYDMRRVRGSGIL
ncbi:MAG: hypothetical protein Q7U54_11805, partial [Bacteroidales bacterium]|nr:hypothetical protein [Bacteroidales bacterium]